MQRGTSARARGPARLRWAHLALVALIAASFAVPSTPAAAATGTVVAAESVNIRACAALDCPVIGAASLGDEIEVTGEARNGFYSVRWFGQDGFASTLYIDRGGAAPWFQEGDVSCAEVAIIFNIGIGDTPSQRILDTLVHKTAPTTMFPMGWWAETHPDYLRALDRAGFVIGTHGDQPRYLTNHSDATIRQDLDASVAAIEGVLGHPISRLHTPYADDTDDRVRRQIAEAGYLPTGWEVDARDYADWATEAAVYDRVMRMVYPGAVIEFHLDGPATETSTARALPRIIDGLRAQGYSLVTVPDLIEPCLGAPSEQAGATATVANTGGMGLNCRTAPTTAASRITTLAFGSTVTVRGATFNGWVPLQCGGQNGWASGTYLSMATSTPPPPPDPEPERTLGTVVNTGGASLNCRTGPSTGYGVITQLPAGATVTVRGGAQDAWYPVVCGGRDGWVSATYLSVSSAPAPDPQPTPTPPPTDPDPTPEPPGDTVVTGTVSNTGGAGLNCRTGPSTSYGVITVLAAGSSVTVRGGTEGGWVPVTCGARDGWVSATYLTVSTSTPAENTGTVSTNGLRANCRTTASFSGAFITSLANGTEVVVRGARQGDWVPIECANRDGWVYADLIDVD